ncbi:MAG: hypothetical protein F6K58_32080 [Symploca sp. SIO2E9]|nr:hypothetical protein [Symploca sp. SIO2E9]
MSNGKTLQSSPYSKRQYNIHQPGDFDSAVNYSRVLLAIAGAEGELAEAELDWYINELVLFGCTEESLPEINKEYISTVKSLNWKNVNLEELLGKINFDFPMDCPKVILYQAIKMCRADREYHQKEKEAIRKAAQILGVSLTDVTAIESLVEMEESADKLRYFLLGTIS